MTVKPILKWAGGKSQLLGKLLPRVPKHYGKYIEPFFGGGSMFFALQPQHAIIADSNPEIVNVYKQVADNVESVIQLLSQYKNTEECFYNVRSQDWEKLEPAEAAARTLYLNKTCFNGLYRVNKKGQFNTPFGHYKNPTICDAEHLRAASDVLKKATIICGDYLDVLDEYAEAGDFIFLDPPYVPVSEYADFKRYTKEQFYLDDHKRLAEEVKRLYEKGCFVILTNSNADIVHELYADYKVEIVQTKRAISSKGNSRKGEDVIVSAMPKFSPFLCNAISFPAQMKKYPPTRFMGSKRKILPYIAMVSDHFEFDTVLEPFSGSGIVSYMYKCMGKQVTANDYMSMCHVFATAMIENKSVILSKEETEWLLTEHKESDHFVEETFRGLYFPDEDNHLIDTIRTNIAALDNEYKRAIAMTALIRACMKKRPRGLFTYVGLKTANDDGRRDLKLTLEEQFRENVEAVNEAVFDNGKRNAAINEDALLITGDTPDLVYIDPPYYTPLSDNEYVRRYHFLEGLARNWEGVEIQQNTKTKKFRSYPTPFSTRQGAVVAFDNLFEQYKDSILIVSYSSNCLPTKEEMIALLKKHKQHVDVVLIDYTYSFGNQKKAKTHRNTVQEYLFVGY